MFAMSFPPITDTGDGKARGVMGNSQADVPLLVFNIIDSIRRGNGVSVTSKIVRIDFLGLPPPSAARIVKVPYEFLLFCVGADDGVSLPKVFLLLLLDVLKLLVAVRMGWPGETLATRAQGKPGFFKRRPIVSRPISNPWVAI